MPYRNRLPAWLKTEPLNMNTLADVGLFTGGLRLHTVCESARCPNRQKCFASSTATFMILGDICTRNCTFCAVKHGKPTAPDPAEPEHVVEAVARMGIRYAVITSVTRDDLPDGGASHFAQTIKAIKSYDPEILVEVLVPDFKGSLSALQTVIEARPAVFNHNVETVPRLYTEVRPGADYRRSLAILKQAKSLAPDVITKSGLMVGLGETRQEITEVMADLRMASCDLLTIGQYLQPSFQHHEIKRYVHPTEFDEYRSIGESMGFITVMAGPLVRSSLGARETYMSALETKHHNKRQSSLV